MSGLPLKYRLLARVAGVNVDILSKIWAWMDGKKTVLGLILTATGGLAAFLPMVAVQYPGARWIGATAGVVLTVNGLLHKAWKMKYGEEHVDVAAIPAAK